MMTIDQQRIVMMRRIFPCFFYFILSQVLYAQAPGDSYPSTLSETNRSVGLPYQHTDPIGPEAKDSLIIQAETCREKNGSIRITGPGEIREWQYSLDGHNFQSSNTFSNLAAGWYTIYLLDEAGYTHVRETEVPSQHKLVIDEITITPSACLNPTGSIKIYTSAENEFYTFSLSDKSPQSEPEFESVAAGKYTLRIEDAKGCSLDTTIVIPKNRCPLYIPNVFSPNGDGINDLFQIRVADDEDILITRFFIFDRWGNNVYKRYNLPLQSTGDWWDGTYKHFTSSAGTFDYYLEVLFENGQKETFKGNVTLIR